MAVVIETTLGDITVDLYLEQRPATCLNFLKLCKMKYYNFNLFHTIRSGFIAQTGDPTGEGSGGESIWGLLEGSNKRFFSGEKMPKIRHTDAGLLSMVCTDNMMVGSQFFFTLAPDLDSLDGVHCVIGEVTEGHEVLTKLNEVICDETHRPYQDVRITHTVILEDPFNDMPGLRQPSRSPSPNAKRLKGGRIAPDEEIDETQGRSHEEIQEMIEEKEAKARATILEIVGDLPDADIAPPENVLFVCKLNPVTTDDDLEIIFSRFGKIVSCEVIKDKKTNDSLQYAFIEFEDKKSCEDAYFKMDNVLIDDRRIHVDFSQSVSKMRWLGKGRGVQYFNVTDSKPPEVINNQSRRSHSRERNQIRRQHYKDRESRQRDKTYSNDKKTDAHRERKIKNRSRSRSRSYTSKRTHIKKDSNRRDNNYLEATNSSKHNKDSYSNSRRHGNNYESSGRLTVRPISSTTNDRQEHSQSHVRRQKHTIQEEKNYKRDKMNATNNSHKVSKKTLIVDSDQKERKQNDLSSKLIKVSRANSNGEVLDRGPHTPSPLTEKKKIKSEKTNKVKKLKRQKNNAKKNEKKRKASTTTSESETSDSTSSSSDSSSSSEGAKKRRVIKRKKRNHSSSSSSSTSSSTSSSDSTSTSSSSSSDSSTSTSENDKKRSKKNYHKKTGKKTKQL